VITQGHETAPPGTPVVCDWSILNKNVVMPPFPAKKIKSWSEQWTHGRKGGQKAARLGGRRRSGRKDCLVFCSGERSRDFRSLKSNNFLPRERHGLFFASGVFAGFIHGIPLFGIEPS
jgi:hypothetical protein